MARRDATRSRFRGRAWTRRFSFDHSYAGTFLQPKGLPKIVTAGHRESPDGYSMAIAEVHGRSGTVFMLLNAQTVHDDVLRVGDNDRAFASGPHEIP